MEDLLSNLPLEIRFHILSKLTTKEAAITSSLSKKWRNLFAFVPNLDFDESDFLQPVYGKRARKAILRSFINFVDRVLTWHGNSPIRKFSLKCSTGVPPDHVNRWLCQALYCGVSDLDLTLDFDDVYKLPEVLFVSRTLVSLKITTEFGLSWWAGADGTFLPRLKCLNIDSGRLFCDSKIEKLLPCFPVLEELHLVDMEWIDSDETVASATVTKLLISATGSRNRRNPKSVSFDTPSLLSLAYSDIVAEDYPLVNMKNLIKARIILFIDDDQLEQIRAPNSDDDVVRRFRNVVKLLNGIQNVQQLHLHSDTLEVLSLCCESMPVFNNVKTLGIKSDVDRGWEALPVLLKNCPNLEVLVFESLVHHVTEKCGDVCDCIFRKDKGQTLKSCPVKVVEVRGFEVTMKEMHLIEHFLDYFPSLKEMKIYVEEDTCYAQYNPQVFELILDMVEDYKECYSCSVDLYTPFEM